MQNMDTTWEQKITRAQYQQRKVVTASDSEKAFIQVNRTLGIVTTWVAGISAVYLLLHMLRWISNG